MQILKEQEDGSVGQRFSLAALQKCSGLSQTVELLLRENLLGYLLDFLNRSLKKKTHQFTQEFAAGLIGNLLGHSSSLSFFKENPEKLPEVLSTLKI